jgi:hypothetical protein
MGGKSLVRGGGLVKNRADNFTLVYGHLLFALLLRIR